MDKERTSRACGSNYVTPSLIGVLNSAKEDRYINLINNCSLVTFIIKPIFDTHKHNSI